MKHDIKQLQRRMRRQIFLAVLAAIAAGFFILYFFVDGVLQEPFANAFIGLFRIFGLGDAGYQLYHWIFQSNKFFFVVLLFVILMILCTNYVLRRFCRYFSEVGEGIDQLVEETEGEIKLSKDMDFMARELNAVKDKLKRREEEALMAEQRKNDLVVYLAHDIKTPLTSVIGYLNLLDEAPDMPAEQKAKYVGITLKKAYRLEQLINEFFEITRYNLQSIVLDQSDINLSYMLMQMADEFYPMLAPQHKAAQVDAPEDLIIHGDADKLARVFNNIFKNAIAYSYENTTIHIRARREEDQVLIRFENQGNTIPPHKLESIFEKFYRLDSARSTNTGGAGLGLAIAKEIVLAHGGSITAQSENDRTVFLVTLPCPQQKIRES